jgi:hypothetical protein
MAAAVMAASSSEVSSRILRLGEIFTVVPPFAVVRVSETDDAKHISFVGIDDVKKLICVGR